MNLAYATDITLEQYELFESLLSPASNNGRPRSVNLMLVLQARIVCAGYRLCLATVTQ